MDKDENKRRASDKSSQGQGGGGFDLPPADLILGKGTRKKKADKKDPYRSFSNPDPNATAQPTPAEPDPANQQEQTSNSPDPYQTLSKNSTGPSPEPGSWPIDSHPQNPNPTASPENTNGNPWPRQAPEQPTPPPPVPPPQAPQFPPFSEVNAPGATGQIDPSSSQQQLSPPAPTPPGVPQSPFGDPAGASQVPPTLPYPPEASMPGNSPGGGSPSIPEAPSAPFPPPNLEPLTPPSMPVEPGKPLPPSSAGAIFPPEHQSGAAPMDSPADIKEDSSNKSLTPGKSLKKFDDRKKDRASKALFGKKNTIDKEEEDENLPAPTFTRVQSRRSLTDLPAQTPPEPTENVQSSSSEPEPTPQEQPISLQLEWSSTSTSESVNSQKPVEPAPQPKPETPPQPQPEPAPQSEPPHNQEVRSLDDTNQRPVEAFPQHSSTEWQAPQGAMQLTSSEEKEAPKPQNETAPVAKKEQPEKQKPEPVQKTPKPPPHQAGAKPQGSLPLPKMKSFGNKSKGMSKTKDSMKPAPHAMDPRLLAKQSPDVTKDATDKNKLYDVEGKEISEPREITKPEVPQEPVNEPVKEEIKAPPMEDSLNKSKPIQDPLPEIVPPKPKPEPEESPQEPVAVSEVSEPPAQPVLKEAPEVLRAPPPADPKKGKADLQQAKAHIRTAESALSNDNYSVAIPLLNKALLLITESGALMTPEALSCHQKLGECSYQKGDYDEAAEHYVKCKNIIQELDEVQHDITVLVQQKLAKALEKAKRFSEAKRASQESIDLANDLLDPGHPLVSVGYRMHLSLLQKTNAPNSEIESIERELNELDKTPAKDITVSDEVSEHVNYLSGSFKLENIEKQRKMNQARERMTRGQMPSETKRFNMMPVVVTVILLIVVGGGGAAFYFMGMGNSPDSTASDTTTSDGKTPDKTQAPISKAMQPYIGKTLTSADGLKTMTIGEDHSLKYTLAGDSKTLKWKEGDPKKNLVGNLSNMVQNKTTYLLIQTHQGFMDPDKTILYNEDAPDLKVVKEMKHITELANFYYSKFGKKYPSSASRFDKLGPNIKLKNPLGKGMKPLVRFHQYNKDDGQVILDEYLEKMSSGAPNFKPDNTGKSYPGLIECASLRPYEKDVNADGIAFIIRGIGQYGKFISSSKPGVYYTLAQEKGVEIKVFDADELEMPFDAKKETTIHFVLSE